jgi:ketosteroid isomerase-like protein
MLTIENEKLIQEYLDIAVNASEDLERTMDLLSEDCTWYITPPGVAFTGKKQLRSFTGMAMGSRSHNDDSKVEIRNWFADDNNFCVEYFHAAILGGLHIKVVENVCLVCHIQAGKFDRIHEYVDTSQSLLIGLGLKLLPLIIKGRELMNKQNRK